LAVFSSKKQGFVKRLDRRGGTPAEITHRNHLRGILGLVEKRRS
jgi:hypothetical protein